MKLDNNTKAGWLLIKSLIDWSIKVRILKYTNENERFTIILPRLNSDFKKNPIFNAWNKPYSTVSYLNYGMNNKYLDY